MLARTTSFIGISNSSNYCSGYSKRNIFNTIVRAAATAAVTTTGVSSGTSAFLLAHNHNHNPCTTTAHSFGIHALGDASSINRSYRRGSITPAATAPGPSIGSKRARRMFSSSLSDDSGQEQFQTSTVGDNSSRPLQSLCLATLEACEAVTPAVEALYRSISNKDNDGKKTTKTKADDSVFTIADGLVQYLLSDILLGQQAVGDIVGEEDCAVNLATKPYTVDDFVVPAEFEDAIDQAIEGVTKARDGLLDNNISNNSRYYQSLTAFIDPIDGTREFSTQKGEQCSICVGFADIETGKPVAGVVYRPLSDPHPTWAAGAKSEAYVASSLLLSVDDDTTKTVDKDEGSLLTSNGGISPFLDSFMNELDYERVPSGGAGNKMLMLLEGKGTAYIQDRGVSRWDTCGAQAVLEAHGGILCKLDGFLEQGGDEASSTSISYTYRKTEENLDFVPGNARLTKYNVAEGIDVETTNNDDGMAMIPSDVKPYALCGLVALGKSNNNEKSMAIILDGLRRAAEVSPPAFD